MAKAKAKSSAAKSPASSAGKVPIKGGARVAQESGSRSAPIINIGIDREDRAAIAEGLSRVLAEIHAHDVDFADLYFQHARFEGWSLEEGIVKSGTFNIDRGVGVRAVSGDRQAYAYSDDISLPALTEAAHAVRAIARQGQSTSAPLGQTTTNPPSASRATAGGPPPAALTTISGPPGGICAWAGTATTSAAASGRRGMRMRPPRLRRVEWGPA